MKKDETNYPSYPEPFKIMDGCLYREVQSRNGSYDQKLCNFLPYIISEVTVDDGVEEIDPDALPVLAYLLEHPPAPREVIWPLLAFTFLTPLNHFLHAANCEPKFVFLLQGRTGARKSSLAALFLSFFGGFTASDLPLSFRDTANSIIHNAFTLAALLLNWSRTRSI